MTTSWQVARPFLLGILAGFHVCAAEAPLHLAITSMAVQGDDLILTVSVPPGLEQITLETRPTLDVPWDLVERKSAPAGGGEMTFLAPQTPDNARFFRLVGSPNAQIPPVVSAELEFVATTSLSEHLSDGNAVFHFNGRVDGSDKILITRDGAFWNHINWGYPPEPVAINDSRWDPREKNYMSVIGPAKFLPEAFSLDTPELELIKGRDIVALERTSGGIVVYLDDTPIGSDEYEFNIKFPRVERQAKAARTGVTAHLKIESLVSGSDCIKITASQAVLEHKFWNLPSNITINGVAWDPIDTHALANAGETRFLPEGVDFSTARIVSRKGRDLATAWGEKDAVLIRFADNPNGSDSYEIEIAFGPE